MKKNKRQAAHQKGETFLCRFDDSNMLLKRSSPQNQPSLECMKKSYKFLKI